MNYDHIKNHKGQDWKDLMKPVKIYSNVKPGISRPLLIIGTIAVIPAVLTVLYFIYKLFTS